MISKFGFSCQPFGLITLLHGKAANRKSTYLKAQQDPAAPNEQTGGH